MDEANELPLEGIRVVDTATLAAAPWLACYLGEFGADVIKVEQPKVGDHQRRWGSRKQGEALFWKSIARNKRSITLNLRDARGAEILKRLLATADVLVENFRPGTLERWGLGPEVLQAINPGLVVARVSGFGQTGPYRQRPGFGTLAEGFSGFAHLTGQPDGPPTLPNLPLADGVAGLTGAYAVMLALYHRDVRGGAGQVVDISLCDPLLRLMEPALLDWDQLGVNATRTGNRTPHVAPRNLYRCADDTWVALSASAGSIFERLASAIGRPDLVDDPRFATNEARIANVEELDGIIGAWIGERNRPDVLAVMGRAEVAMGPIYDARAVYEDPHFKERRSFVEVEDPRLGPMRLVNVVPRLSATPGRVRTTGPDLGQHNEQIYGELGLTGQELHRLREEGVL
ncbi:MAG: CoA transferase [Candidatus Dormiibacterota bacterium]